MMCERTKAGRGRQQREEVCQRSRQKVQAFTHHQGAGFHPPPRCRLSPTIKVQAFTHHQGAGFHLPPRCRLSPTIK
eukprot:351721-Chlamydomonas_euryale.AAC.1